MFTSNNNLIPGLEDFVEAPVISEDNSSENTPVDSGIPTKVDETQQEVESAVTEVIMMSPRTLCQREGQPAKYCPIVASPKPEGGVTYRAYLIGEVRDVDNYTDLIDTLLMATDKDDYYIFIDSPGGMIASGGIIASAIDNSKANVYTVARGMAASSAALIHSAAKPGNAQVTDMALMMYHSSSHADMGQSLRIAERAQNQIKYVNECLLSKALADGHITQDEFERIQAGEEIYIPSKEFLRRTTHDKKVEDGQQVNKSTESSASDIAGNESFTITEDSLAGNESYVPEAETYDLMKSVRTIPFFEKDNDIRSKVLQSATMCGLRLAPKPTKPIIYTTDKKNFRVYVQAELWLTHDWVVSMSTFLDHCKEDETVTFILGTNMVDQQVYLVGSIIGAMQACKADITTVCAGMCSVPESMIWTFGKHRKVLKYGALLFSKPDVIKMAHEYEPYFGVFIDKAKEIGILSDDDIKDIMKGGHEKLYLGDALYSKATD